MKKPSLRNRNFGCELEFSTSWNDTLRVIEPIINKVYGKGHLQAKREFYKSRNNFTKWHFKTDSSTECELCSPISKYKHLKKIHQTIKLIQQSKKIKVTKIDGFHVHVEVKDIKPENILALWLKYEKLILTLFPSYRRKNSYCQRAITSFGKDKIVANFFKIAQEDSQEHHFSLSFYFFKKDLSKKKKRKTVEFRVAEGTIDPVMVKNWVLFCLHFVQAAKKINIIDTLCDLTAKQDLDEMLNELYITNIALRNWLRERQLKFNSY